MPADVFFIAGEASGDLQGALLARELGAAHPAWRFTAAGGQALAAAGADVVIDSTEFAGIGPLMVLAKLPSIYAGYVRLDKLLRARPPRLLVPIDSGSINLRLLGRLRRRGFRGTVMYYFPPAAWLDYADTARRTADLAVPVTPFAHQRDFYRSLGLRIEYFGHPLVSVIEPRPALRRDGGAPLVAVLPGSRREEVFYHLPVLARAAAALVSRLDCRFAIVAASAQREAQIRAAWPRLRGPERASIERRSVVDVLADADVAWSASGTAVLEAALREVPQIAFYVTSATQYRLAQRRIPQIVSGHMTLPNLVLGREIVTELKQHEFTAARLVDESLPLLENDRIRARQVEAYGELRAALGPPDALARIAEFATTLVGESDR